MLPDAASKAPSMAINARMKKLLKEVVGIEEQSGLSGGRGCSDGGFYTRPALKKRRGNGLESRVLFAGFDKAIDSESRGVFRAVLARIGVPPHLACVTPRINTELEATFNLNGEPVAVPCFVGVKKRSPLSPRPILLVMHACLDPLDRAMPAEAKLRFRQVPGANRPKKGGFKLSFWASPYADDAAAALDSRENLVAATSALQAHLKKPGLLMHISVPGGRQRRGGTYGRGAG